nr:plectin-like [Ciona intestinalis]|eukprot:XP_002120044.1 plectin-like [Ciona intestinalis]
MALPMSPGILAAVCILSVELVVIIVVITFLLWKNHRGTNKGHDIPTSNEGNFQNDESLPIQNTVAKEDEQSIHQIEQEVEEIKEDRMIYETSSNTDSIEKKQLSSSSDLPCTSSDEDDGTSLHSDKEHTEEAEETNQTCALEIGTLENSRLPTPPPEETVISVPINNSAAPECEAFVATPHLDTPGSSVEEETASSPQEPIPRAYSACDEKNKYSENDTMPRTKSETITPLGPSDSIGGITLSLRIDHGIAPIFEKRGMEDIQNNQSLPTANEKQEVPNKIEVIRRCHSQPQEDEHVFYDPYQKKFLSVGDPSASSSIDEDMESLEVANGEEAIAGIINVTSGDKLTICQAVEKGLIPKKTAISLLEAQAATGCVVNPRSGVKLSVTDAVKLGIVDEHYKTALIAAEGAFYGYLDPRTGESISLNTAMKRGIFPRAQGLRLLEAQVATGGVINPWTGKRYSLTTAVSKGLIDQETSDVLMTTDDQHDFFDPNTKTRLGYADILGKCIRDLDTGLKFLYIEEKPKNNLNQYQPDLLSFRSAFRKKVTLQDLIDADLVEAPVIEAFQAGKINKEQLRDIFQPILVGSDPIGGVWNRTTHKILSISQAVDVGLLRRGTALELLEAQAATGSIIDPMSGKKMSVSRAVSVGLVNRQFATSLKRAEQATIGYTEPGTNRYISLFEAMHRGVVIESYGIRLLEAQIATGGLIDPIAGYRIPPRIAMRRGLFDERLASILSNTNEIKGYYDPSTEMNLTYGELMARCVRKKRKYGDLLLFPIKDTAPMASMQKEPYRKRKIIIVDPKTKRHMSVNQAVMADVIDQETAENLKTKEK